MHRNAAPLLRCILHPRVLLALARAICAFGAWEGLPVPLRVIPSLEWRLETLCRVGYSVASRPVLREMRVVVALRLTRPSRRYISVLLMLVYYIFAVLGVILLKTNDPWQFGTVEVGAQRPSRPSACACVRACIHLGACTRARVLACAGSQSAACCVHSAAWLLRVSCCLYRQDALVTLFVLSTLDNWSDSFELNFYGSVLNPTTPSTLPP